MPTTRRTCIASGIARSTPRYRWAQRDDCGVIAFIQARMVPNPRHRFGLLRACARRAASDWIRKSRLLQEPRVLLCKGNFMQLPKGWQRMDSLPVADIQAPAWPGQAEHATPAGMDQCDNNS